MNNPRMLISFLFLFTISQLVCNMFEGNEMYANMNISSADNATEFTTTTMGDSGGGTSTLVSAGNSIWHFMSKLLFFDYTIFYNVDSVSGEKTANDFSIFRYLLICMGIVMWIDLALTLRKVIAG